MSEAMLWDVTLSRCPALGNRSNVNAGVAPFQDGHFELLTCAKASYPACQPSRQAETITPHQAHFDHSIMDISLEAQRREVNRAWGLQQGVPASEGIPADSQHFDISNGIDPVNLDCCSPQSSATHNNHTENDILSPPAIYQPILFDNHGLLELFNLQLLDSMDLRSSSFTAAALEEHSLFPIITNRVDNLSVASQRLFRNCGQDPVIQSAVLDIFESHEFRNKLAIRWETADPLLEKVKYVFTESGKGKRGAPQYYKCRWGSCGEKMSRRLHALEHVMNHVDNRSHICEHCRKGFVRKNELKKHLPCKALKRKWASLDHQAVRSKRDLFRHATNQHERILSLDLECQLLPQNANSLATTSEPLNGIALRPTYCPVEASAMPQTPVDFFGMHSSDNGFWLAQIDSGYTEYSTPPSTEVPFYHMEPRGETILSSQISLLT